MVIISNGDGSGRGSQSVSVANCTVPVARQPPPVVHLPGAMGNHAAPARHTLHPVDVPLRFGLLRDLRFPGDSGGRPGVAGIGPCDSRDGRLLSSAWPPIGDVTRNDGRVQVVVML